MIDNLIDIARVGIGYDLNMSFDDVANFEVLDWGEIRVMTFTMASVVFSGKNF